MFSRSLCQPPYPVHRCLDNETLRDYSSDQWQRLRQGYQHMQLIRQFDRKAINLQRTGQLGTYASCLGAEAISTAAGMTLTNNDRFVPYYRDHACQYLRGVPLKQILQYWGGDERGNAFPADSAAALDLPNCVPIASQLLHAAGIATALKQRQENGAVLASCGDGATSRGDFYEALNLAGVWQLPLVVLINNNQWAISVPLSRQTASVTLAHKAQAAGIPAVRVDGNDLAAMLEVLDYGLQHAREGKGPLLVEAISYRLSDHTTADDASRYRSARELQQGWQQEPLSRLRQALATAGYWDAEQEQQSLAQCQQQVDQAIADYLAEPPAAPTDMLDYLYAELPDALQPQRQQLAASQSGEAHG